MTETTTTYDVIAPARAGFKRGGWVKIDETEDPLNYGSPHVRFRRQADNRHNRAKDYAAFEAAFAEAHKN